MNLKNKIAVITGGCGNVGYATATEMSQHGAQVIALVRQDLNNAMDKMSRLGNGCYAVQADVTDSAQLKQAASQIGRCDILVNAAGVNFKTNPMDISSTEFDSIINTNLKGTYFAIQAFYQLLNIASGLVVNISSTGGIVASPANLAYGASKAGVDLLTKSLAKSLAPRIRVVGIAPGMLDNAISSMTRTGITRSTEFNNTIAERIPAKRLGTARDVAELVINLATNMTYVTGQTIILDGGVTL
jgi:3-oxoacyl-[acyl-carrier protein] reductase